MSFDLVHIWTHMGALSKGIAGVLLMMAIASIGVAIERMLAFAKSSKESQAFAEQASPLLDQWDLSALVPLANKHQNSPLARLFGWATQRYLSAKQNDEDGTDTLSPVDLAKNEVERRKEGVAADLRRGMNVLASVGSVAPFVGLLGTVVGIITAFQGIGASGSAGLGAVSAGIAEALVETALGLMVAIPAVLFYNYLTARVNAIELSLSRSASELLDELENHYGRVSRDLERQAA